MRKRSCLKRTVCYGLILSLCVTSFTGCGKKKSAQAVLEEAKKVDKNCIFKPEDIEGVLEDEEYVLSVDSVGGKIKVVTQSSKGGAACISFNPDGSDIQRTELPLGKNDYISQHAFDNEGNLYYEFFIGNGEGDGNVLYSSSDSSSEEAASEGESAATNESSAEGESNDTDTAATETSAESAEDTTGSEGDSAENNGDFLVKCDSTGKEIYRKDLSKLLSEEDYGLGTMMWNDKYGLICGTAKGIQTYDDQNGFSVLVDAKELGEYYAGATFVKGADNQIFIEYYGEKGRELHAIDFDKKKLGDALKGFAEDNYYNYFSGEGYDFYASDNDGIYGYDCKSGKLTKLLDYNDSNVGSGSWNSIYYAAALSEKEIIACVDDYNGYGQIVRLTKVNPEDVKDKVQITFGSLYVDPRVGNAIMNFNRASDEYSIKILDYSKLYPDAEDGGEKQFNLDITSGNVPDLIEVSNLDNGAEKYINKGVFLDLTSAFEEGGALGDIELLPNIAEMMKYDGKYYTVIPSFGIQTYAIRSKYINGKDGFTYKECDDLIKSKNIDYATAFGGYPYKTTVLSDALYFDGDRFIDRKNKKCNFNSADFIELLNFAKNFPEEPDEGAEYVDYEKQYAEDKGLFYRTGIYNIEDYTRLKQAMYREDFSFVGFPNIDGKDSSAVYPTVFAVSSKSEHLDSVYSVLRDLFNPDEKMNSYEFSSNKAVFEAGLQEAAKEVDENSDDAYFYSWWTNDKVKKQPLSQEEIQKFEDYVLSVNLRTFRNDYIENIVNEESAAFYAGQKTAEQVAEIIQNRVNVYINENS